MANKRFEMYEYRHIVVRMRQGDSDRALSKAGLIGRPKAKTLRAVAAAHTKEQSPAPEENAELEDDERVVSLRHRALPVIELLKAAVKAECNVMWDSNN